MSIKLRAKLSTKQLEKLSDLFMDLAKGSFAGAIVLPIFSGGDMLIFLKLVLAGIMCTYISLMFIKERED